MSKKVLCIYHKIDLDGWMSAAIVKLAYDERNKIAMNLDKEPEELYFFGYNYGDNIPMELINQHDTVILVDISFPKEIMYELSRTANADKKFIWIDHHISAIKDSVEEKYDMIPGIRNTSKAACELVWDYFFDVPCPLIVNYLGLYDSFRHKGTEQENKILEFQYGARSIISSYADAYEYLLLCYNRNNGKDNTKGLEYIQNLGEGIFKYLKKEASSVMRSSFSVIFEMESKKYKFIAVNKDRFNPSNFELDYHEKGYDGAMCFALYDTNWSVSLYNENGEVDCSVIAKQFGGGGHKGAAGFRVPFGEMEEFLKKIKDGSN